MSTPLKNSGKDSVLLRPVPSGAFASSLRGRLLEHHRAGAATSPLWLQKIKWLGAIIFFPVLASVIFLAAPRHPLSSDGFLTRAEAAAFAIDADGILYQRTKHLYVFHDPIETKYSPYNTPYITEMWKGYLGDQWVVMDRTSLEDGTRLQQILLLYPPNDDWMVYPQKFYGWWKDRTTSTPVCVTLAPTAAEQETWKKEAEDRDQSGTMTVFMQDDDVDLLMDLNSSNEDSSVRIAALRELVKRGTVRDISMQVATADRRVFQADITNTETDEDGNPIGEISIVGHTLYYFDTETYKLVREEELWLDDAKQLTLSHRADYLEQTMLPISDAAKIFNPAAYSLADAETLLPVSRTDMEQGKAEQGCYASGDFIGDISAVIDLGDEAYASYITLLFARGISR